MIILKYSENHLNLLKDSLTTKLEDKEKSNSNQILKNLIKLILETIFLWLLVDQVIMLRCQQSGISNIWNALKKLTYMIQSIFNLKILLKTKQWLWSVNQERLKILLTLFKNVKRKRMSRQLVSSMSKDQH